MKKVIAAIVAVVVITGGVYFATKDNNTSTSKSSNNTNMQMKNNASGSTSNNQQAATNAVTISNFAFSPASITVKKGTTVTWTNKDSTAHTVAIENSSTSPELMNGDTFSRKFDTAGTFKYHCSIHPDMTGAVTVTE